MGHGCRLVSAKVAGGGRAISAMADVAEPSAVEAVVARAEKRIGSRNDPSE
jgi:hypothetical protein